MGASLPITQAVSAGGVVYRRHAGDLVVAVCGRTKSGLWALPKGTPDQGETLEETAVREVKEETGLCVEIEATLGNIEYWFARASERVHKKVYFYLMGERGGSFDDHDLEFDVIQWIVAGQALQTLTYPTEREVVRRALDTLGSRAADAE